MTKVSINQFVSSFSPRDAVGNIILAIRDLLREAGYSSEIYAEMVHKEMKNSAKNIREYDVENKNDILIYHHGFASDLVNFLILLPNRKILVYHNITPAHFFRWY